jgi:hypothetical protein
MAQKLTNSGPLRESTGKHSIYPPIRLSQLQKRILQLLAADYQRTNGGLSTSHQELVMKLPHDRGNISHSLRMLEKRG